MPTYVYKFVDTGETIEVQQSFDEPTPDRGAPPGRRRAPPGQEGLHSGRHHVQGQRLLQDRQPRLEEARRPARRPPPRMADPRARRSPPSPAAAATAPRRARPPRRPAPAATSSTTAPPPAPASTRTDVGEAGGAAAEVGVFGGSGFYEFLTDVTEVRLDTPYGLPSAPVAVGDGRRAAGGLPASSRPGAPPHPERRALPRQRVGDEGAGRAEPGGAVLGRLAPARPPPRRLRGAGPAGRPDLGPSGHLPRRPARPPRGLRRPLRRPGPSGAAGRRAGRRHHRSTTAARWWSSRGRGSAPEPSRAGSARWAGTSST